MPRIDSTYFGSVVIDGRKFDTDMIICWDGDLRERQKSHIFEKREFEDLMMKDPDVIIIGTGQSGLVKVDPSTDVAAKLGGVEIIAVKTPLAIQEFNKVARKKKAIAVIHVTC